MGILDGLRPRRPATLRIRGVGEPTLYFETSDATEIAECYGARLMMANATA